MAKAKKSSKRTVGRPREYDPLIVAKQILEWSADENSINIAQFCALNGYVPMLLWRLERENDDFNYAYTIAKLRLAERRERLLNSNELNYGSFQRYQSCYDPFLDKFEEDKLDKEATRKKGIAQQEQTNLVLLAKLASQGKITQKD